MRATSGHAVHEFTPDSGALLYGSDEGSEFMAVWRWDAPTGSGRR